MLIKSVDSEIKRKNELQEIATKLAVANEELRRLDNTKSEFISIASHQLRTPLTAIKGFLSLVLEGSYGKISLEVEDVINKAYSANNHLVDLVENLLNISRIESGRIQYSFAKTDIADVIRELADSFSVVAKGRHLNLAFVYPEVPLPLFLMDSQKIREVISNMIDNALKYTQEGGVAVRLSRDGEKIRVAVSDTGVGIAPEDLSVLFQKFRRGKESGKVNVSGTGLGLYVGKSFAEAHGGRIFVESEGVGKGSTFILELPFRTEEDGAGSESKHA
jgi:signal transduction histidine kinase